MMCLGTGLLGFILFGIVCASWTCGSFFPTRLRKFSVIIPSNRFSNPYSFSSLSGIHMIQMLLHRMSPKSLKLSFFFFNSLFFLPFWLGVFAISSSKLLIQSSTSYNPLLISTVFFFFFSFRYHILQFWVVLFHAYYFFLGSEFLHCSPKFLEHPCNLCFELCIW